MSFQSAWGFDPDELMGSKELNRYDPSVDESTSAPDQCSLPVPLDLDAQLYELRRMFGL
jgi:hypothetical protein